jgi:hypothetical protein
MEEDLFRLETGQIYSSHILVKRAKVAVTLMDAYRERGDIKSVFSIYDTFDCSGDPKVLSFLRMGLMMSLFLGEVPKVSCLSKAENTSQGNGFKPKLVPNSNMDPNSRIDPNFKLDLKSNQDPNSKLELHLAETIPHKNQEQEFLKEVLLNLRFSKNKADCNLSPTTNEPKCFKSEEIIHKVNLGLVNDALILYFSDDYQETSSKDLKLRARAALAIGLRLSDDSDYQNLIRLYNTGVFKELDENDFSEGALVLVRLLNHFCEMGEIKLARELFLEFPKLEGSAGITILRTAAAIILTQAAMLGKDTLGMELMVDYFLKLTPVEMRVLKSYRFKLQERYRELKKEKNID